ncbi:ABC-2 family transporter protein-domain-containing protein [Ochromonadaceae sp. CCMP2298]|nr:ABC-2 family transporter protein-domain-containing protein [Ochromonadaceae sp. CCMP2298]
MRTNLTMLSNVTLQHAAPVYLKEVLPVIYAAMVIEQAGGNASAYSHTSTSSPPLAAQYLLFSHPLPVENKSNAMYAARGYEGSTMVVMYMLITTAVAVRHVIKFRQNGVKLQLHTAGMHPLAFWGGNFAFDATLLCATLCAVLAAVFCGGAPISLYFFDFDFCGIAVLLVAAFSVAVVGGSYALCCLSEDQLAAQLLTLVSAAVAMFMKLYLDRQSEAFYKSVAQVLLWLSPCFAFTTSMFDLIKMHAGKETAYLQGKAGPNQAALLDSVHLCLQALLVQAIAYLALAVLLDMHWVGALSAVERLRGH